jgi:TonB family protein
MLFWFWLTGSCPLYNSKAVPAMKRLLLVLPALSLLLSACSSVNQITARSSAAPAPIRVADRDSAWGLRPSYDAKGQSFDLSRRNLARHRMAIKDDVPIEGTATVDLLVDREGTVQDAAIVSSSGDRHVDELAIMLYRNARYSLHLKAEDPAPYVVNQTVTLRLSSVVSELPRGVDYGRDHYEAPTYAEGYSSEAPNTVNGFPR